MKQDLLQGNGLTCSQREREEVGETNAGEQNDSNFVPNKIELCQTSDGVEGLCLKNSKNLVLRILKGCDHKVAPVSAGRGVANCMVYY